MSNIVKKIKGIFLISCFIWLKGYSQLAVANYSGCPNQIVTITASWPNVAITTLSLVIPGGSGPVGPFANPTFTISHPGPGCNTFTLYGTGLQNNIPVSQQAVFNYCVVQPAPLVVNGSGDYCFGQTAVLSGNPPPGASFFNVTGPGGQAIAPANNPFFSFNVGPLTAGNTGTYLVTSVGTCTITGTATINVAPNNQITVGPSTNVCQGGLFSLSANLVSGVGYNWIHPINGPLTPGPNKVVGPANPNDGGVYTVTANIQFNQTFCPVQATAQVNVVATNPVAVAASPNGILCQNDKLTLIANAGNTAFLYNWTGPANFNTSNQSPVINQVSANNSGTYVVTAFFTNSIITCPVTNSVGVTVVPVPPPVVNLANSVCQGVQGFTFGATAGQGAFFSWVGPNGFVQNGATQQIQITQPANSGLYCVTAKYTLNTTTCAASSCGQLNVIPVNTVSVIPPASVCQPNNAQLQASATGANLYTWAGPNGFAIQGSNPTIYYPTPAATGVYTVTAYFGGGATTCTNTATVSLNVYPVMHFSLVPLHASCAEGAVSISGPVGATSYTWTSSNGFTSNDKDIQFPKVKVADAGSYTLNISLGPCVTSGTALVIVYPPIQFTLVPQNRTVCSGDTTIFEAGVTGGTENPAFSWTPPLFLDDPTGPVRTCVPKGSMIYNLTAHDIRCPDVKISHSFSVNVNLPPEPKYHLDQVEGCAPFTASLVYDGPQDKVFTVTYDFGGLKQIQDDTLDNFQYTLRDPGTYTLFVRTLGTNTCSGVFKYPDLLVVNPRPGTSILTNPDVITPEEEIKFIPSVANGPAVKYSWTFKGGAPTKLDSATIAAIANGYDTSVVENPVRKYEEVGKYVVMLITENEKGCIDTAFRVLNVTDDLRLFVPNVFTPNDDGNNDGFMVKGTGMKPEGFSMEILDRWGKVVFFTRDINTPWNGQVNGKIAQDNVYIYKIRVVGMNNEGRKEFIGRVTIIK